MQTFKPWDECDVGDMVAVLEFAQRNRLTNEQRLLELVEGATRRMPSWTNSPPEALWLDLLCCWPEYLHRFSASGKVSDSCLMFSGERLQLLTTQR